ncbi:MAG: TetR/AcrR family transcriptional regulator, partial [Cyanobacteria bacterium J06627_28]
PGYSEDFKQICLKDYAEGKSFRAIERARGVHHTTVITWAKKAGIAEIATAKSAEALTVGESAADTNLSSTNLSSTVSNKQAATFDIKTLSYPNTASAGVGISPAEPPPAEPVDERSGKAEAILLGALEMFTVQGYAAASMSQIAATAGVSKPTLYSYFKDKEGLFTALIEQILARARHPLDSLTIGHDPHASPKDVFRQIARTVVTEFASNQRLLLLMRLIIGESGRFPELAKTFVREIEKPMFDQISAYLKFHPSVQVKDPMVTARIFVGALVHYLLIQHVLHGEEIVPLAGDRMIDGIVSRMMAEEI